MYERNIFNGADLYKLSELELIHLFGKMGYSLYRKVRGIDNSAVQPSRERKSVGREHTYGTPLTTEEEVLSELRFLAGKVNSSLTRNQKHGKIVVLKLRNTDYETMTKRISLPAYVKGSEEIFFTLEICGKKLDR